MRTPPVLSQDATPRTENDKRRAPHVERTFLGVVPTPRGTWMMAQSTTEAVAHGIPPTQRGRTIRAGPPQPIFRLHKACRPARWSLQPDF